MQVRSLRSAASINCQLMPEKDPIREMYIDGQMIRLRSGPNPDLRLNYAAPPPEGFRLKVILERPQQLRINVFDRSPGLPEKLLHPPLPEHIIPGPGNLSNVTITKKNYAF